MKRQQSEPTETKDYVSKNRRTKRHRYLEEETVAIDGYVEPIFGKFTRPVGTYRRGYKRPME